MSTPTDEIAIDLEAADAKAAAEAAKKTANGANAAAEDDSNTAAPDIDVVNDDMQPQKADKTAVSPEEGLEKLKKQLEDERSGRLAAEQRANDASRGEAAARGEVQTSQLDLVKGAIERLTESSDTLEGQYADAMAAQDWKAAAKAHRQMSDNSAKLTQLEAGKKALEAAPKPTPRVAADPVEQFASALSPASATWVRAHPEFVRDPHKNRQMIAAHELALARGHKADTAEYFASVEKTLDLTAPAVAKVDPEPDATADAAQAVGGRAAPAAAPVSRRNGAHGNRPGVVTLTPEQADQAHFSFPDLDPKKAEIEYARNMVALRKEGKLS
jgi:hypothetical protein